MEASYHLSAQEALEHFQVDEHKGLSDEQIQRALEKYGPNGTVHHRVAKSRTAVLTLLLNSAARRPSHATVEARTRAVQRSTRHHTPRIGGDIIRTCSFRG